MADAVTVDQLYEARRSGSQVPGEVGDVDLEEALGLQVQVAGRFAQAGDPVVGYKVGFTSGGSRDFMGPGFRPFGYVPRSTLLRSGDSVPLSRFLNCSVEPEVCVILGSPLRGANVTPAEARAAVKSIAASFEIIEQRVPGGRDTHHATLLADGVANWGIVVGEEAEARDDLIGISVELFRGDELVASGVSGDGGIPMDDPYLTLARAAALLDRFGCGLEPGQAVITGSFANAPVEGPGTWRATFSTIGDVSITFS